MAKQMTPLIQSVPLVVQPGFLITNLTVDAASVTLAWKEGVPPFQIEAEPSLSGPWNEVGGPTLARTKTFPKDFNQFFRVIGNIVMPVEITHTNPTTLTWSAPEIPVSDSLTAFRVLDAPSVPANDTPTNEVGWTLKTTIQPGQPLTYDDTSALPRSYKVRETTSNGVLVPYSVVSAGSNPMYPGWPKPISGSGTDAGQAIAVDSSGNIYVAGTFCGTVDFSAGVSPSAGTLIAKGTKPNFPADLFIAKYTSAGTLVWVKGHGYNDGGTFSSSLTIFTIAVDSSGNVFVGGRYTGTENFGGPDRTNTDPLGSSTDAFVAKYDSSGNWVWDFPFGGSGNDQISGIAIDSQQNVLVAGSYQGTVSFISPFDSAGAAVAFLIKLANSNAAVTWAHGGLGDWSLGGNNGVAGVVVDKRINPGTGLAYDNILITGSFSGSMRFGATTISSQGTIATENGFIAKILPSGSSLGVGPWARQIGFDTYPYTTAPRAIALDSIGNVSVAGTFFHQTDLGGGFHPTTGTSSGFLATYSGIDGAYQREQLLSGNTMSAVTVGINSHNNIVLAGAFTGDTIFGSSTSANGFVAAYSPSGVSFNLLWSETFSDSSGFSGFNSLAINLLDPLDYVALTGVFSATATLVGKSFTSVGSSDIIIARLNQ